MWLVRRPDRRAATGALLAFVWNFALLFPVCLISQRLFWWNFGARGGLLLGIPVDLVIGWSVLWGPAVALAFPGLPLAFVAGGMTAIDLLLMPFFYPVVSLGPGWLAGEALALAVCFVPSQLLGRWTTRDIHLRGRAVLQFIAFSSLMLAVLPAAILQLTGENRLWIAAWPPWTRGVALQLLFAAALPGLSALCEFCQRGRGTPVPYDPPRKLVTTGVYAYVANPMQASLALLLVGVGAAAGSLWLVIAGLVAVAYGAGFARWHEDEELARRFGEEWRAYRRSVAAWRPRWRPYRSTAARLYVAESCGPCSALEAWLTRRHPRALEILPAEEHPTRDLLRLTYEDGGWSEEGVAAFARALEHIDLRWAALGCLLRLPGVRLFVQVALDVSGGGPRRVGRRLAGAAVPAKNQG